MCCTLRPARLTQTILYAAETEHLGKPVHVLGYENHAENLNHGPNAMLLPLPSKCDMGPENIVDTKLFKYALKDMSSVIQRREVMKDMRFSRGLRLGSARAVQVFDSGSYTVVLADDASDIPEALNRVPESKRPELNDEIFHAYSEWYPKWKMALCCFDGKVAPEPLLWWFEPKHPELLFTPALDSHNGRAPRVDVRVVVDHDVVFGSLMKPTGGLVRYRDTIPVNARHWFMERVIGQTYHQSMPNGDFVMPVKRLHESGANNNQSNVGVDRVPPPSMW